MSRACLTCKFVMLPIGVGPCDSCDTQYSSWEPAPSPVHNDLAVGYRAGQADGCERADGLLLELVILNDKLEDHDDEDSPSDTYRREQDTREAARAYLREKGLLK